MKRGRGRPKGSGERVEDLHIRLSPKEKERLQHHSKAKGTTITQLIQELINQLDTESHDPNTNPPEL